jgi:uncharacterized spore protein YtfJ
MNSDPGSTAMDEVARIPEHSGAAVCFGTPVTAGERTVIPVAEVSYGLGFGWGGSSDERGGRGSGGGAGGGTRSRAVAVIEVSPDSVRILPIEDQTALRLAGMAFAATTAALVSRTLLKVLRG